MERIFILVSLLLMGLVLQFQNITSAYKHDSFSIPVHDVLFNIIPPHDFSWLYFGEMWGLIVVVLFAVWQKKSPYPLSFIIFAFVLFFLLRSIVLIPTGIGSPAGQLIPDGEGFGLVHYLQNDMFFSGHSGSPFLLAILFWNQKYFRYFFLLVSFLMAYAVLAMRIHYTIDIIGAWLAAFAVYHASLFFYPRYTFFLCRLFQKKPENTRNIPPSTIEN